MELPDRLVRLPQRPFFHEALAINSLYLQHIIEHLQISRHPGRKISPPINAKTMSIYGKRFSAGSIRFKMRQVEVF
jgi:hypothetical protein